MPPPPPPTFQDREDRYIAFGIPSLDRLIGCVAPPGREPGRAYAGYSLTETNLTGAAAPVPDESATFCLIGPDGTGKSLFALHLASDYWRRTHRTPAGPEPAPRIIYASTDLSYERAVRVWETFWLNRPWSRYVRVPFEGDWVRPTDALARWEEREHTGPRRLRLQQYVPVGGSSPPATGPWNFAAYLAGDPSQPEIAFLDLESTTSGDDWAFLHKVLAVLEPPDPAAPRHLLVIDAVEGLETLVGERDAFGQEQTRRARIAQLVRAAAGKCHLVLVVEEPKDGERLPEVFVADTVVRLRSSTDRDYARRTVELEKVRGQKHIRGQHDFRVRQEGSTTGSDPNPDDPRVGGPAEIMAYIQVFPSLHYLTRDLPREARPPAPASGWTDWDWKYAATGIYQLDAMLWQARGPDYPPDRQLDPADRFDRNDSDHQRLLRYYSGRPPACLGGETAQGKTTLWHDLASADPDTIPCDLAGFDQMGLPAGSITTLIGNDSTYKSQLARSFLSQCFRLRHALRGAGPHLPVVAANERDPLLGQGVGILLATYDTDPGRLAGQLRAHLIGPADPPRSTQARDAAERWPDRLIVRGLEPHHLPSALFVHTVRELVQEAKRRLRPVRDALPRVWSEAHRAAEFRRLHGRIRLVIDDWSTILATYPEVQRDPLVLPFLLHYLRREGVTTLILATRSGNPHDRGTGALEQDLRELRVLADHHLYTWHVSFFDERRVAITVQPSSAPDAGLQVRELRPGRVSELPRQRLAAARPPAGPGTRSERARDEDRERFDPEALVVDPHFELYSGLQDGRPVPVPLEVRLFAEREDIAAFQAYLGEVRYLFRHLFGPDEGRSVLRPEYGASYETLRALSFLQSEARLDHTLVLQVDEFWADTRSELRRQDRYLLARTVDRDDTPVKAEDPFGLFQLTDALIDRWRAGGSADRPVGPRKRVEFFDLIGYDCARAARRFTVEKVPYSWDFGFLVCNGRAWDRVGDEQDHRTRRIRQTPGGGYELVDQQIRQIWNRLWKVGVPNYGVRPEFEKYFYGEEPERRPLAHWTKHTAGQAELVWDPRFGDPPPGSRATVPDPDDDDKADERFQPDPVSWREFFGACKTIAKATRYEVPPFDVDLMAVESFSCLVLEVWFSEVYQAWAAAQELAGTRRQRFADRLAASDYWPRERREDRHSVGLTGLLGTSDPDGFGRLYRRALYRSMLLLDEMFGQGQLPDQNLVLEPRPANPKAAAARHWYSTASVALKGGPESRLQYLVGLPGHFTVRGDWFLAVARGSRSARLGERAMDILCSRRANITRLQTGLGLPVRDLFGTAADPAHQEQRTEYWTSLPFVDDREHRVPYKELRKLAAFDAGDRLGRVRNFHWLWRSTLRQYDLHSRMWQKWLDLLLKQWRSWKAPAAPARSRHVERDQLGKPWWDGFAEYDYLLKYEYAVRGAEPCHVEAEGNERWSEFNRYCDSLIEGLQRASRTLPVDPGARP
jgi:KaiC/GvpD/RAD55 family RecA-like ATPase